MSAILRLSIVLTLRMRVEASLGVLAPVCSSFVFMNRTNNKRSWMFPLGAEGDLTVENANLMANRLLFKICVMCVFVYGFRVCFALHSLCVCCMYVQRPRMSALGVAWLLEQPFSSVFAYMPRFQFFCTYVLKVRP